MELIRQELSKNKPVIWYSGSNIYLPEENTMSEETNQGLPEWISTKQAAEIMRVEQDTVAEHCRNKTIECMKIGTSWAVSRVDAENFERSNRGRKPKDN